MIGYVAGTVLVMVVATWLGLDAGTRLTLALAPPAAFLIAVKVVKLALGYERIVFYQQALVAVAAAASGAAVVGGPVGRAIDLATLGVGTFLVFGRIGCFKVACCHGRLARRGVTYRVEHALAGFPRRWFGHRVFPIQLVDSALSATMVAIGTALVLDGAAAGVATCAFVCGYGVGRFCEELVRGDPGRPSAAGLSEAQWTALVTVCAVCAWRPSWWSVASVAALILASGTLFVSWRRDGARFWLSRAAHAHEFGDVVGRLVKDGQGSGSTSRGLRLSAARLPDGRVDVVVSRPGRPWSTQAVAALVAQLGGPWAVEVVAGHTAGLCHIIVAGTEGDTWSP